MHHTPRDIIRSVVILGVFLSGSLHADPEVLNVSTGRTQITTGETLTTQILVGTSINGATGTLEISGGTVTTTGSTDADFRTTYIGAGEFNSGALFLSGGTLNVGQASTPGVRADFEVGSFKGTGAVTQTGGALVMNSTGGYFHIGNQGTGVYSIEAGTVTTQNAFVLGRSTSNGLGDGTLNISGGVLTLASATKGALILGGVDASNTVTGGKGTINQTGGTVKVGQYLELGTKGGSGSYTLNGGTLELGGAGGISRDTTGTYQFNLGGGTIKVTGTALTTGLDFNVMDRNPSASVYTQSFIDTNGLGATFSGALTGDGTLVKTGLGTLTLSGANAITGEAYVIGGAIAQTGGASTIRYLGVGSGSGVTGDYTISGGSLAITNGLQVGDWGGNATFTQSGGAVSVNGTFNVGNQGGTGNYVLSAGTLTLNNGLYNLGRNTGANAASNGTFTLSGGTLEVASGNFILGNRDATATAGQGSGILNQTGGVLRVVGSSGANNLFLSAYGNGTYNLSGGTLEVGSNHFQASYTGSGAYAFNFGGGTIKVIGSDLSVSLNANLVAGRTSTIDTNGLNATWSGQLLASGLHQIDFGGSALVKTGAGTLTLSGTTRTLDTFAVKGGSVRQTTGATTAVELMTGTGAGNTGSFTFDGGTLQINASTQGDNITVVAGTFRVGDFGGTGTFTQNAGTIQVGGNGDAALNIGNQGGHGTYQLNGGTLILRGGDNTLARSSAGHAASSGALAIAGGLLHLQDNSALIIGNNLTGAGVNYGSGSVVQTGGTLRVDAGSALYIAGHGNGTFSLNGGTLEIGGTSLQARYNNSISTYAFNLGGGTLKVTGSALTTNARPTFQNGTTSTLNTNGFSATFSEGFAGSGNLTKTGLGALILEGTSSFSGTLLVSTGSVQLKGSAANAAVTVGLGAVAIGTGSVGTLSVLNGGTFQLDEASSEFTVTGNLNLAAGSVTLLRLSSLLLDHDQLHIGGTLFADGTLDLRAPDELDLGYVTSFTLFNATAFSGRFDTLLLPTLRNGFVWDTSALYTTGTLGIAAAIPEPSTWAGILGGAALVGALWHRRARRRA